MELVTKGSDRYSGVATSSVVKSSGIPRIKISIFSSMTQHVIKIRGHVD